MLPAVLAPFAQLTVYEAAFPSDISHHRGIAVASLVGTEDSLFLRLRVVEGGTSMSIGTKAAGK